MRIGIDYRLAVSSNRGMGRYCREIVDELQLLDMKNEYILYIDRPVDTTFAFNFRVEILGSKNFILGEQIYLSFRVRRDKLDALWCPSNTFPLFLPRRLNLVVTIHDLIFMQSTVSRQSMLQRLGRIYRRMVVKIGKRRIDTCLSVSKFSALDIQNRLGFSTVKVTYNCIDTFYAKVKEAPVMERGSFYFTLSGDAPNKNLQFLIDFFKQYKPYDKLVIAGLPSSSVMRKQASIFIEFIEEGVSDERLISLYCMCKVFLFLSLEEGFGIPILEALVCDAPIIGSNTTSMPEVLGEFGIQISPQDTEALVRSLELIETYKIDQNKRVEHIEKFLYWRNSARVVYNTIVI